MCNYRYLLHCNDELFCVVCGLFTTVYAWLVFALRCGLCCRIASVHAWRCPALVMGCRVPAAIMRCSLAARLVAFGLPLNGDHGLPAKRSLFMWGCSSDPCADRFGVKAAGAVLRLCVGPRAVAHMSSRL